MVLIYYNLQLHIKVYIIKYQRDKATMIKNIIYAVLLGVGMAACLSQQEKNDDTTASAPEESILPAATETAITEPEPALFVVGKQQVGNIQIGMPIGQMREHVANGMHLTDTTLLQEGMQSTAYVVHPEGRAKGLVVEQACKPNCEVWRISVLSPDFRTSKGITVGSKYSELQQAYKISTVTFEEGNLAAIAPDAGMSFILDHSSLPSGQVARLNASTVPANLLVRKILVY